jgi:hypothetical protein
MATGDAYPLGTLLCANRYKNRHVPIIYLGFFPFSFINSKKHVIYVNNGNPVDVVFSAKDQLGGTRMPAPAHQFVVGWDERETILTRYHLWDPTTCPRYEEE